MSKKIIIGALLVISIIALSYFVLFNDKNHNEHPSQDNTQSIQQEQQVKSFDKTKYSFNEPGSIWWTVNKNRPLPEGYVPPDLIVPSIKLRLGEDAEQMKISKQLEINLTDMFNNAEKDNVILVFGSGFRSYELQKEFYDSYVAKDG